MMSTYWVLDDKTRQVWQLDRQGNVLKVFAGAGEGPGELGMGITSFSREDDFLQVVHTAGNRIEKFDLKGNLLKTERVPPGTPLLFARFGHRFLKSAQPGRILWQVDGTEHQVILLGHEDDLFQSQSYSFTPLENLLLVATNQSHLNLIHYAILDLATEAVKHQGEIDTILQLEPSDYPELPPGMMFNPTTLGGATACRDHGFVLTELSLKEHKSPTRGLYQAIHIIDPVTGKVAHHKMYCAKVGTYLTVYQHLSGDDWVGLNEAEGQVQFLRVELK